MKETDLYVDSLMKEYDGKENTNQHLPMCSNNVVFE
jgi:hypothetical protein